MKIQLFYFARIKELLQKASQVLEREQASTVQQVLDELTNKYPGLAKELEHCLIAVNEEYQYDFSRELCDGDHLALIPPVSGG
jgi:molybdopterin synthase sulfur carrier subunit